MNNVPYFESFWKNVDVDIPVKVYIKTSFDKRVGDWYLYAWIESAYVNPGISGRGYGVGLEKKNDVDRIVYGPSDNIYFLKQMWPILEVEMKKLFKKIVYEYVDFRRPVVIHIEEPEKVV